jgi:hypothetical protein
MVAFTDYGPHDFDGTFLLVLHALVRCTIHILSFVSTKMTNLLNNSVKADWLDERSSAAQFTMGSRETLLWKCLGCDCIYRKRIQHQKTGFCGYKCAAVKRHGMPPPT